MPNKRGVQNKKGSPRFLLNLINGEEGGGWGGVGISKIRLISVMNEKRDIYDKCLILMLKLK